MINGIVEISYNIQFVACSRQSNIQSPNITKKSERANSSGQTEYYYVALFSLEAIDGVYIHIETSKRFFLH